MLLLQLVGEGCVRERRLVECGWLELKHEDNENLYTWRVKQAVMCACLQDEGNDIGLWSTTSTGSAEALHMHYAHRSAQCCAFSSLSLRPGQSHVSSDAVSLIDSDERPWRKRRAVVVRRLCGSTLKQ